MLALFKVAGLLRGHPVSFRIIQGVSDFVDGAGGEVKALFKFLNIIQLVSLIDAQSL